MNPKNPLPPPAGYPTWLDYAVATMDVRSAQLIALEAADFDSSDTPPLEYDDMRAAAREDLAALRRGACTGTALTGRIVGGDMGDRTVTVELPQWPTVPVRVNAEALICLLGS